MIYPLLIAGPYQGFGFFGGYYFYRYKFGLRIIVNNNQF